MVLAWYKCPKAVVVFNPKGKEVVSDFVSKAVKKAQHVAMSDTAYRVKMQYLIQLTKCCDFVMKLHNIIPTNITSITVCGYWVGGAGIWWWWWWSMCTFWGGSVGIQGKTLEWGDSVGSDWVDSAARFQKVDFGVEMTRYERNHKMEVRQIHCWQLPPGGY